MFIVAGLGNPGLLYQRTRHNAGFQALDVLADYLKIKVTKRGFSGVYGEGSYSGERVVLVKPTTYMNLSGDCIQALMHFYKCPVERLVVLYDDIELPVGSLRIRDKGSAGTHNGMRSIIGTLGSGDFPRVRIGVASQTFERFAGDPGDVDELRARLGKFVEGADHAPGRAELAVAQQGLSVAEHGLGKRFVVGEFGRGATEVADRGGEVPFGGGDVAEVEQNARQRRSVGIIGEKLRELAAGVASPAGQVAAFTGPEAGGG